ncbi:Uncharacterised protein [Mycobacteroides abscessus subsp. abscessus]|nr:Uncharacterised protein [Mycobacteroides abscessus subsp. abscessus]
MPEGITTLVSPGAISSILNDIFGVGPGRPAYPAGRVMYSVPIHT